MKGKNDGEVVVLRGQLSEWRVCYGVFPGAERLSEARLSAAEAGHSERELQRTDARLEPTRSGSRSWRPRAPA